MYTCTLSELTNTYKYLSTINDNLNNTSKHQDELLYCSLKRLEKHFLKNLINFLPNILSFSGRPISEITYAWVVPFGSNQNLNAHVAPVFPYVHTYFDFSSTLQVAVSCLLYKKQFHICSWFTILNTPNMNQTRFLTLLGADMKQVWDFVMYIWL